VILVDVNVLLYAFRVDAPRHTEYRQWLIGNVLGTDTVGVSDLALSAVIRIATHPRIYRVPSTLTAALAFVREIRDHPATVSVTPGPRHWELFIRLCESTETRGNLVTDAYLAALAIESGCEWVPTDRDFARFPGLRWRHPLAPR